MQISTITKDEQKVFDNPKRVVFKVQNKKKEINIDFGITPKKYLLKYDKTLVSKKRHFLWDGVKRQCLNFLSDTLLVEMNNFHFELCSGKLCTR